MTSTSTTKLICPECRRENEPERIYCHECGAKLDRSKVIASKPADARVKEQKRVHKMFDARRAKMRLLFFKICKLILGSCAAAIVASMILPPDVDKASGLSAALNRTKYSLGQVVGIGDAENDLPLIESSGFGVAVANALPILKRRAALVTSKGMGSGVVEVLARILALS